MVCLGVPVVGIWITVTTTEIKKMEQEVNWDKEVWEGFQAYQKHHPPRVAGGEEDDTTFQNNVPRHTQLLLDTWHTEQMTSLKRSVGKVYYIPAIYLDKWSLCSVWNAHGNSQSIAVIGLIISYK